MNDRERGRGETEREGETPHFGNLHERVETLKRVPPDDAVEYLKTIIESAFREGHIEGQEEGCRCATKLARAMCCCRRRDRDEDEDRDDFDDRDRGRDRDRR